MAMTAEVILVLVDKEDLQWLRRMLQRIRSVLKDAERRRIEDEAVNHWLNELKGVMYDADDILDLCRFEGGKLLKDQPNKSHKSSSSASPVRSHFSLPSYFSSVPLRHEIGQSIKKLNDRLEEISNDKLKLSLEPAKPDDNRLGGVNRRQTSPLVEYSVVGRDIKDATNKLVEWIVGEEKQKCGVLGIVGMGGLGKTTLAQNLFNEPRIKNSFRQLVRVCVSKSFSETNLLKQIIRSAGGDKHLKQCFLYLSLFSEDFGSVWHRGGNQIPAFGTDSRVGEGVWRCVGRVAKAERLALDAILGDEGSRELLDLHPRCDAHRRGLLDRHLRRSRESIALAARFTEGFKPIAPARILGKPRFC